MQSPIESTTRGTAAKYITARLSEVVRSLEAIVASHRGRAGEVSLGSRAGMSTGDKGRIQKFYSITSSARAIRRSERGAQ